MKKIFVVIPAYNAARTVESVFERIPKSTLKKIYKFIVVNDGSKDDTVKVNLPSVSHTGTKERTPSEFASAANTLNEVNKINKAINILFIIIFNI